MNIAPPKKKKRYRFYSMTCNELEQPPQAKVKCLNMHTSSGVEAAVCKQKSVHRSCRKFDRKRGGQLLFSIITVSYNARYAKLREAKNAHFPDFWRFSLSWLISGLVQPFCTFCNFYHILWFYLSHAYRCFLRYALLQLLHRFICNSFYFSKHLCAYFITFHVAAVDCPATLRVSMDAPVCIAADCL